MRGTHGSVGGNIFLLLYALAVFTPGLRVLAGSTPTRKAIALLVLVGTAALVVHVLRAVGGGGAGEPLGLLAGAAAWIGRLLAPALGSRLVSGGEWDLWAVTGASALPALLASILWWRHRRHERGRA